MKIRRHANKTYLTPLTVAILSFAILSLSNLYFPPTPTAYAQPNLKFPFASGARWKVIQGYNGPTHTDWERYAFDLVREDGLQGGQPVLAAADGIYVTFYEPSGTVIIEHPDYHYTQYTHLATHVLFAEGQPIKQGQILGTVGNKGAPWAPPHIHFVLFRLEDPSKGIWDSNWLPVPFQSIDGRSFPADDSIPNQYLGATMVSSNTPIPPPIQVVSQVFLPLVLKSYMGGLGGQAEVRGAEEGLSLREYIRQRKFLRPG